MKPFAISLFALVLASTDALADPLPEVPDEPWADSRLGPPVVQATPSPKPQPESRLTLALESDAHFPTNDGVTTTDVRLVQLHLGWRRGVRFERGIHVSGGAMVRVTALSAASESVDFCAQDTGSHLDVSYHPFADPDDGLKLTIFPFDADPLRLGWTYPASVGGREFLGRVDWVGAPGASVGLNLGPWFVHAGLKLHPVRVDAAESANEQGTTLMTADDVWAPSVFANTGLDLLGGWVRLEAGFGYIDQGDNPIDQVYGEQVYIMGGSWRVAIRFQSQLDAPLDRVLLSGDPNRAFEELRPVRLSPDDLGILVVVEGVHLVQRLADPNLFKETTEQASMALVARQRVRVGGFRLELAQALRSLPFMVAGAKGYVPYTAFHDEIETTQELYLSATADYRFWSVPLTVGLSGNARLPAMLHTELFGKTGPNATPTLIGEHNIIVSDNGERIVLPQGEDRVPQLGLRLHGRMDIKEQFLVYAWAAYGYDGNQTFMEGNADLTQSSHIAEDHIFSFGTSLAWRF